MYFPQENCDDLTERSTEEEEAVAVWVGRLRVMLRPPPPRMSVDAATTGPRVVAVGGVGLSKDGLAALMALEHLLRCDKVTRKHGGPIVQEVSLLLQIINVLIVDSMLPYLFYFDRFRF